MANTSHNLRGIPAAHRFLSDPRICALEHVVGKLPVKESIEQTLSRARMVAATEPAPSFEQLCAQVVARLEQRQRSGVVNVINATGVLLHTNLGRAPLARKALAAMNEIGGGYSNLEYDLEQGRRGSRYERGKDVLCAVTGAQDCLVVNNCAAAMLLVLDTLAKGRQVLVSRGELIEIGGGFRLPEVLERSGALLVEVGTTNKTYVRDFERALTPLSAILLRTHTSNYRIAGFTHEVSGKELAALGARAQIPAIEDLGGGALVDLAEYGLAHERTVQQAIADGLDLVTFSGDKLLGGPQAGIIAGSSVLVARLRANPLLRALRADKLTFAALIETVKLYADPQQRAQIPFFRMLATSIDALAERARGYCSALAGVQSVPTLAYVGGGALPDCVIPSIAIVVASGNDTETLARRLRTASPPIVGRVEEGKLLLDLRTIAPEEDARAIAALGSAFP